MVIKTKVVRNRVILENIRVRDLGSNKNKLKGHYHG